MKEILAMFICKILKERNKDYATITFSTTPGCHPIAKLKKTSRMQSKCHNPHLKSPRWETNDNISLFKKTRTLNL